MGYRWHILPEPREWELHQAVGPLLRHFVPCNYPIRIFGPRFDIFDIQTISVILH